MSSILSPGTKKMNKENKLVPGLPSGFEDRWDKKLLIKKKLLRAIEKNFIKFGAEALETPSFEISENIGSFLAEDEANPMSCLLYTSPSPRDGLLSRMPSSA